ncbi:hypothetical protein L2E82_30489 [Cichorium intybus]|uniref:Uncharacterized protein n=1 Tax=Cichorium intybus TaxID=13427 RepID=A0ACB9D0N1_CICIN|nr:hypothetical protein L2E82_30489 [Cichorium intybus]
MVTRGRAHQLTAEEPAITATVAGTYLLDSEPAAVMFDSGATHSFTSAICEFGKKTLRRPHSVLTMGIISSW